MSYSEKVDRESTLPHSRTKHDMPPRRIRTWTTGFAVIAILYLALTYGYGTKIATPSDLTDQWHHSEGFRGRLSYGAGKEKSRRQQKLLEQETQKDLVPLEAHIMSKCPDARVRGFPIESFLLGASLIYIHCWRI